MPEIRAWLGDQYTELTAAVRFLSILPLPGPPQTFDTESRAMGQRHLKLGSAYFSLVGVVLGLLLYALSLLCDRLLPHLVTAALLVVALVLLTGGLHLDGLMDACDGLFGGKTRERRLEIMRDSRVGSFGVLGGACVLLLKFACFGSLSQRELFVALLTALPSARWALALALGIFPSARPGGLGVIYQQSVTEGRLALAGGIALLAALLADHLVGLCVWVAVTVAAILLGLWIARRIGGLTGDTYGAIAEVTEVVALLVLLCLRAWV